MSVPPSIDTGDNTPFHLREVFRDRDQKLVSAPTKRNAMYYNMKHPERGIALIFSHDIFDDKKLQRRTDTKTDCQNLAFSLRCLGFDVREYSNLNYKRIVKTLKEFAKKDHSEADCFAIVVLSYGNCNLLHACDKSYESEIIWSNFTADKCPSLAGKPKLIFINGCQSVEINSNLKERTVTDGDLFRIPNYADFLIVFSSHSLNMKAEIESKEEKCLKNENCEENLRAADITDGNSCFGCFQVDTPSDNINKEISSTDTCSCNFQNRNGSLFIKALCKQLRENGTIYNIHTLLTYAIQSVVADFENQNTNHTEDCKENQEFPYFVTMLTRLLQFNDKK